MYKLDVSEEKGKGESGVGGPNSHYVWCACLMQDPAVQFIYFYALTSTGITTAPSRRDLVALSQCQVRSPHEFLALLLQVRGHGTPSDGLGFLQTQLIVA
jgi:hypothetical protein